MNKELKLITEAGISNLEALKGATSSTAITFGLKNKDMVTKGYIADLILINENPLGNIEDIEKIETVWKAGKKVKR